MFPVDWSGVIVKIQMDAQKREARAIRVLEMNRALLKLFPRAKIALHYSNSWELLVAVILSAQCTDIRVNEVTDTLFAKYPALSDYAKASLPEFESDIHSCGFFRNKAKNILETSQILEERFEGVIPRTMEELLSLAGVARKTANIVLYNAFNINEGVAVDTHVRRFAIRFDLSDYTDPVRIERDLMEIMPKKLWGVFNDRVVRYGREVCTARSHPCEKHPLTELYPDAADIWPKAR